jgi:hypothetical protein
MTGAVRSLIAMADCPICVAPVYLGSCEPYVEDVRILVDQPRIAECGIRRMWQCQHVAEADGPGRVSMHRWVSSGYIEFRPVLGLHVDVVPR